MAATGMGLLSEAISLAGRLRDINNTIGNAEFSGLLAELQLELAEAKVRIADLVVEGSELRARIAILEGAVAAVDQMTFDGTVYRKDGDESGYCPACWDASKLQIRLTALQGRFARLAKFTCPHCKSAVGIRL
ncbi:hypothetical protein [Stenotrophomonas sp. TWI1183]|uniref:hypothetical protein n=1 Tax=Stenotrophomonas sp. TWI1183 TaxID=3136799 RepID=UPI0032086CDB